MTPYLTVFIAFLLISKTPTFSFKKISINPRLTIFILFIICVSFLSLIFFTFQTLLFFSFLYLTSIPISSLLYFNYNKKDKNQNLEVDHEDVL